MRLLLVNPRFPESFWSFRFAVRDVLPGKRALNPPLGLATLAGLTPPGWEIRIVDENVEPLPLATDADVVGVCGMGVQFERQRELLRWYREAGHHVVAGGSYASLCPERYTPIADTVVAGEAEYVWPRFCRDFERGAPAPLYQERGVVDVADSPVPRFDLLALERYVSASMQFSRGCPFRCDFCDIIVMFGRRPRTKRVEQIGRELDALRARGTANVFFVDDNLIGNKGKAKELLRYLADYQHAHGYPFQFGTEASLNLATDHELLELFRRARFGWVFIGIESPDEASLRETGKMQNTRVDMLASVRRIYAHGIDVLAGFIVGFDNDTTHTFERQYRFITDAGIQVAMVGLLTALPRTPLYERLRAENRLIEHAADGDNTRAGTNLLPKRMSYDAMVEGFRSLHLRLTRDDCIAERIRNKMRILRAPVHRDGFSAAERIRIVLRFLLRGLLPGGPRRWRLFAGTLARCTPRAWPLVISEWITGLALRGYARRFLAADPARPRRAVDRAARFLRRRFDAALRARALEVRAAATGAGAMLALTLRSGLDGRFYAAAARRLERMLRRSEATLTLRIGALAADERRHLERLLGRLARHGDRITLRIAAELRHALPATAGHFRVLLETG